MFQRSPPKTYLKVWNDLKDSYLSHAKQNQSQSLFTVQPMHRGAVMLGQETSQQIWTLQGQRGTKLNNKLLTKMEMSPVLDLGLKKPHTLLQLFALILSDVSRLLDIVRLAYPSRFKRRHLFPAKEKIYNKKKKRTVCSLGGNVRCVPILKMRRVNPPPTVTATQTFWHTPLDFLKNFLTLTFPIF